MNETIQPRLFIDISLNINNSIEHSSNETCEALRETFIQAVSVVPALVAFENVFFLVALALYRSRLKHNNVYRYVASALTANFVTSALGFYHFMNYYYGFEPTAPNPWWAFRKGMTVALSLILCGNIGLLIYAIDDCTYVVGRTTRTDQSTRYDPKVKKRKAKALICLVWALPTIFGLLAMTDWNCTKNCLCTLSYPSHRPICPEERCSHVYTPMSKTYLLVIVILWALECSGLLILLCNSINSVHNADLEMSTTGSRRKVSYRKTLSRYHASHHVLFLLFGLFMACTAPVMVLFVVDFFFPEIHFSHALVNFISPLPLVYCLISPILLSQRLSGLKGALLMVMTFSCLKSKPKHIKYTSDSRKVSTSVTVNDNNETSVIVNKMAIGNGDGH